MSDPFALPGVGEPFQGRTRCCDEDYGGSHYHCGRCGRTTGMYGCYVTIGAEGRGWRGHELAEKQGLELPWRGFLCELEEGDVG